MRTEPRNRLERSGGGAARYSLGTGRKGGSDNRVEERLGTHLGGRPVPQTRAPEILDLGGTGLNGHTYDILKAMIY